MYMQRAISQDVTTDMTSKSFEKGTKIDIQYTKCRNRTKISIFVSYICSTFTKEEHMGTHAAVFEEYIANIASLWSVD